LAEPKFNRSVVTWPIPGAERCEWAAAILSPDGTARCAAREEWDAAGLGREALEAAAAALGDRLLDGAEEEKLRDRKGILEAAVLRTASHAAAALLFSPRFRARYEPLFGPEFLVAIPNRFTLCLFPKHAGNHPDYAPMIRDAYRATPYPVSREVFELGPGGLRAVGVFED
jgi:hypothetical protein